MNLKVPTYGKSEEGFPDLSSLPKVIAYLEKTFPDRCPDIVKDSNRKVWFDAGCVHVVKHLRMLMETIEESSTL